MRSILHQGTLKYWVEVTKDQRMIEEKILTYLQTIVRICCCCRGCCSCQEGIVIHSAKGKAINLVHYRWQENLNWKSTFCCPLSHTYSSTGDICSFSTIYSDLEFGKFRKSGKAPKHCRMLKHMTYKKHMFYTRKYSFLFFLLVYNLR